ncbi:MAG: VWA domain-containing protein [Candidatus Aminicenantes bacterium]|nr:VWA domain-containing protein [Candidatus Aminicenantes bacterium]
MKRTILALAALWIFGTSVPASLAPADPGQAQKPPAPLKYEVTVTLKLIQVYVADPKGNPAADLETADFVLYDNGRPQTITAFEKHFMSPPEVKVQETRALPARDVASLLNRKFIFLIDYEHNSLEGIAKSKKAALAFMDSQLQPGDEVALLSTSSMRALTLHEYLTADQGKVREAIAKLKDLPGLTEAPGFTGAGLPLDVSSPELLGMEKMGREMIARHAMGGATQMRGFFLSLTDLAKVLRQIPGQKNIILFSLGFGRNIMNIGSVIKDDYLSMGRELASANSPVFAVNTATREAKPAPPETSLEYLSKLTGGKYFDSVDNETKIVKDIQAATGSYYVLGYSIGASWDGKFHDIKVEVKRKGYAVSAQKGYFNPRPFNTLSRFEKHLHLLGLALGDKAPSGAQLDFPLLALPFSTAGGQNTILLAEIPVEKALEVIGDKAELISLVLDPEKTIVDAKRVELDLSKIERERVFEYTTAALAPGRYDCRVVLRNMDNGKGMVGACSLTIAEEPPAGRLRLFPPLLFVPGAEAAYLNVSEPDSKAGGDSFSLFEVYPFPSKSYVPLLGELKLGPSPLYSMLRCVSAGAEEPAMEVSAWLVQEAGGEKTPVTTNILVTTGEGLAGTCWLEIGLPQLVPGRYDLHFLVEDRLSGLKAETATTFRVK